MKITDIIFDLGGVILTNDWHYYCPDKFREFSDYYSVSQEEMEKGWNASWPKFRLGEITEDEFWTVFLKKAGAKNYDIKEAKKIWRYYQNEEQGMLAHLAKLHSNYRLSALTNTGKEWLDYKIKRFNLESYFDVIVSSGYSGLEKPNTAIYELLLSRLKTTPSSCLFIDDSKHNLPSAELLGMHTLLFSNKVNLEKDLVENSVNIGC